MYVISAAFLSILIVQAVPAFAATTVTSGELTTLSSTQITDIRNACTSLKLGSSTFCKSVSQKAIGVTETGDPDISITVSETKTKRFQATIAGAVIGANVNGVTFATLSGDGTFAGPADYIVPLSWGTVYFENGIKSSKSLMTVRIDIDTEPTVAQLGSISGRVTDSASGNPIEGALITATLQDNPSIAGQSTSNSNGEYSITGLPPGIYDVAGTASSYQPKTSTGLTVPTGGNAVQDLSMKILPCAERPVKDFRGVSLIDDLLARRESGGVSNTPEYVIESMQYIKKNGFTAVRSPFYWESYVYNPTEFLDRVELIAQQAEENDLCVFFDNHHYYTTSYWNLQIDGKSPGRGFPSFVVQGFQPTNNDYIATAGPFWDAFLNNNIDISGSSVWDVQADFVKTIIARVDGYDSVAGYEILNEPHLFASEQYDLLGNYHTYMAEKIREVTGKKIFFDRENTWGFPREPSSEPKINPQGVTNIVYAPHLYAIPTSGSQAEKQIQNFKTWSQLWGTEVLIGEAAPDTQADAETLLSVLKQNGFGWTVWSWKTTDSSGSGNTYYESSTVPATDVLRYLLAAMDEIY